MGKHLGTHGNAPTLAEQKHRRTGNFTVTSYPSDQESAGATLAILYDSREAPPHLRLHVEAELEEVSRAMRRTVSTLLHRPTVRMKELAADPDGARYATTLHRLFVSGSDRACTEWMASYLIDGAEDLSLHHFYRAMAWLGEEIEEIEQVMRDLRAHGVNMLTLGQYLQPSKHHLPVIRYVHPDEFERLRVIGLEMGFDHVASGPMVRSSYHADQQAHGVLAG